jgi:hypothetical protein
MNQSSEWWHHCEFVRNYFFGAQQKIAQQLAEYLARYYVGEAISDLRSDTDVSALVGESIRRFIGKDDFTMARDDDLFADGDLKESITFKDLVQLVSTQPGLSN